MTSNKSEGTTPAQPLKVGGTNENYGTLQLYSTAVFNEFECVARSFAFTYEESVERAELIASAPLLAEENERLRAEVDRLKHCVQFEREEVSKFKEFNSKILKDNAAQAEEINQLRAEVERLKALKFEDFKTQHLYVKCSCGCHNPGSSMMHFMPCCGFNGAPHGFHDVTEKLSNAQGAPAL